MSGGVWEKQQNGDYVHYSDEEYAEKIAEDNLARAVGWGTMSLIGGSLFIYYNSYYIGGGLILWGLIFTIKYPKQIFLTLAILAILGGLVWYFIFKD